MHESVQSHMLSTTVYTLASHVCKQADDLRAGTDLKLPRTARAAVTLGPRLTKDRLVQGKTIVQLLFTGFADL